MTHTNLQVLTKHNGIQTSDLLQMQDMLVEARESIAAHSGRAMDQIQQTPVETKAGD